MKWWDEEGGEDRRRPGDERKQPWISSCDSMKMK